MLVQPVIFRFDPGPALAVHPGQLVDVYIEERKRGASGIACINPATCRIRQTPSA
jgi:hypothetical protein